MKNEDIRHMRRALKEARKGVGRTSPNPAVGAVLVREGRLLATGYHRKAGAPHAEADALAKVQFRAPGATLYVTLEPCNHQGRTPPCTDAILDAGIRRVVVGMRDPNPGVRGGGCRRLAAQGVEVSLGVLEQECLRLNETFVKFVKTGRPFVAFKSAMTMDGWTATRLKHARWVTGESSRRKVHRLRDRFDAILVGVGTVIADDPSLTARIPRGRGKDPLRIIVDTHLRTPPEAKVVTQRSEAETWIAASENVDPGRAIALEAKGARILRCPEGGGKIDLEALLGILGSMEVTSVLVEGGSEIAGSLIRARLVDKFYLFKSPKLLGGGDGIPMAAGPGPDSMEEALCLREVRTRRYGEDILVTGYPEYAVGRPSGP